MKLQNHFKAVIKVTRIVYVCVVYKIVANLTENYFKRQNKV